MNIVVLLASVLDPKWTIAAGAAQDAGKLAAIPRRLSPFDEAALEVALKLRDVKPEARISVYMPDGPGAEGLLRMVAAHKVDIVARLPVDDALRWDAAALAAQFGTVLCDGSAHRQDATLWLTGREFGDLDDGAFAAALAFFLDAQLVTMAEVIDPCDGALLRARRSRFDAIEQVALARRAVVAVTNHAANRLRHPLMKHVMLAKRADVPVLDHEASGLVARIAPVDFHPPPSARASRPAPIPACAGVAVQVEALVRALRHSSKS
ncbi:hypothetical protein [Cupriavidus sp. CP313]